ncbi:MAG: MaoC/PaaZ C-terminal domain-containing protein [Gammaproteobacteria bacterium]
MTVRYRYCFEDLQVGQRFHSEPITLTAEGIMEFARQYDPQPFHTDPEAAKNTVFGGLLAPGLYTLCLTFGQYFRLQLWESLGSPGLDRIRWLNRSGRAIRCSIDRNRIGSGFALAARDGHRRHPPRAYNQHGEMLMTVECTDFVKRHPYDRFADSGVAERL